MYQLSATLKGHEQDVKGLATIDNDKFASVSRDGTVRLWSKTTESNDWSNQTIFSSTSFLNAITYDTINETIFFGGKESIINGCPINQEINEEPKYMLIGHTSNVCSLSENNQSNELISGSWDKTANVWSNGNLKYSLKGHSAAVWDAKVIPHTTNEYITVSADQKVCLWEKDKIVSTFDGIHQDVIRHIAFIPTGNTDTLFVTCSNDTTIKIFNKSGNIIKSLRGHESFVYDIKYNANTSELISCGEDRSVRIWDCTTGEMKQVIRLPAISIWNVEILPNNDILVGCSDNSIRIFTSENSRVAKEEIIKEFQSEVESTSLNSQSMDFDESKLSPPEVLNAPGQKEGQVVVVKSPTGAIEAHQYSNSKWSKIGEVVGANTAGSDKKVNFEGKDYDYVFDVDVEEGQPALKLPINVSDNPYEAADKFIMRYDLPSSYKDQIVNFILQNTNGISFDQPQDTNKNNTTTSQPQVADTTTMNVLPVKNFVALVSFNPDTLLNGIIKLNQKENTFNDEDCANIGSALYDVDNNIDILYNYAITIRSSWTIKTPAYDIIRLIVHKLPNANDIADFIEEGLDSKNINIRMLTTRILSNSFMNQTWGIQLMESSKMYNSVFETMDTVFENETTRQAQNLALAISTLCLNYSVLIIQNPSKGMDILPVLSDALNTKFGKLEEYQDNEEAAYRLVITYGNLSLVEPTLKQFAKSIKWLNDIKNRYSQSVNKFGDVFADIF